MGNQVAIGLWIWYWFLRHGSFSVMGGAAKRRGFVFQDKKPLGSPGGFSIQAAFFGRPRFFGGSTGLAAAASRRVVASASAAASRRC